MRDSGASTERTCLLHVAGEREQVSEPRAAARIEQLKSTIKRLWRM